MNEVLLYISTHFFTLLLLGLVFVFGLLFLFEIKKSQWVIYFLLVWFPLESLILRYTPLDYYAVVKYIPEIVLYGAFVVSWVQHIRREKKWWPGSVVNKWLLGFIAVSFVSWILNQYHFTIWVLGLRQLFRFVLAFFLVMMQNYSEEEKKNILKIGLGMVILEAVLGIIQYLVRGYLDQYLFFSEDVVLGGGARIGAIEQFWAPGSRIFATMGRYDRLGSFLALGLTAFFPWYYILKKEKQRLWFWIFFVAIAGAIIFTFSRAAMLSATVGIVMIGLWLMRDVRVKKVLMVLAVVVAVYLSAFALIQGNVNNIIDRPSQPLSERLLEAVSLRSWKESYEGYGRIFFIVNTPLVVVKNYPFFGVGMGNYGGGVAATLFNTIFYDRLHLPFGIQNIYGQIDNNWFSIWGEAGTLGLLCWIFIFIAIFKSSFEISGKARNAEKRTMARGLLGAVMVVVVLGFFAPYFEFRALMFYFWTLAGVVLSEL